MKRTLLILALFTLIFSLLSLSAFASSEDLSQNEQSYENGEAEDLSQNGQSYENGEAEDLSQNGQNDKDGAAEPLDGEENIFETVFNAIIEHSGEILAGIAATLSGVAIFVFKKGVLPLLKGGISAIGTGVERLEENSKKQSDSADAISETVRDGAEQAKVAISSLTDSVARLEERLLLAESDSVDRGKLFYVLYSQLEMLYEIFMSSSLPVYEKERVGEQIAKMKSSLPGIEDGINEA